MCAGPHTVSCPPKLLLLLASSCILCVLIVFKILKLSPDAIECAINLRDLPYKQMNLNFSSNDVKWNPREGKECGVHFKQGDEGGACGQMTSTSATTTSSGTLGKVKNVQYTLNRGMRGVHVDR